MKSYWLLFIVVLGAFAVVFGGIPPGYAQEDESLEFQLEDIVVTAMKREMDHQKVPIAMEVITGEDLVGTEKDNVDDILRDVSNIIINKYEDGMRITLRGIGDDEAPSGKEGGVHTSSPLVAVNIDGAYTNESSGGQNLFDLERVEVLAGPQSTLYGSNSPGGVLNVVTASPKSDRFEAKASAEMGSYGLFDGQAMVNVPIIEDRLAMRLSAKYYERDSWIEGPTTNHQENLNVRLKTKFEPSDTFDATLTLSYNEAASGGFLGGYVKLFDFEDGVWANEELDFVPTPVTNPWMAPDNGKSPYQAEIEGNPHPMARTAETNAIQAEINLDTPIGSIAFVPFYNERASNSLRTDVEIYLPRDPTAYYTTQEKENANEQQGADLRITSPEDFPFEWIVGGTWFDAFADSWVEDYYYPSNNYTRDFDHEVTAIYANVTYPVTDKFRGTVGYRYSWDEAICNVVGGKKGKVFWGQEYSAPDYKVGMEYDVAENSMFWASWATSYTIDAMAAEAKVGQPASTLDAYSVGVKNRFLDNKLQLNATAFFYDYQNKLFRGGFKSTFTDEEMEDGIIETDYPHDGEPGTDFNYDGDYNDTNIPPAGPGKGKAPPSPGPPPGLTSDLYGMTISDTLSKQFGAFESLGVDVSVDWVPTPKDRVNLQVSYLNSEWTDAVVDFSWSWIWADQGYDFSGQPAILSPDWTLTASYEHQFYLGDFGTLRPQIDVQYKSEYYLSFSREQTPGDAAAPGTLDYPWDTFGKYFAYPWNYQEAHYMLNASVMFNHSSDIWSLRAYVKNITDYCAKNAYGDEWNLRLGVSDPRTYGAVFSVKY